ncbi:tyrosine-type recombinase/integrase [Blautia massiliensis (ex Durand et al. 2017)]|uniref:tyrosine-type recombinase/integrase n=1 Tax=Blautia massiliensis (ex Durand et al. 2017) TaxID=1737424 RepID=UPI001FA82A2D|nr:tyrosine-type recombinase/integrase [Blautia massiliensis (ex Durand et al. 2017)]
MIIKELTAIRRLSKYLKETYPDIHSAEELNRELLEEYLTYLATEAEGMNNYRMDLTRLRGTLEAIGKLYGYPHLEILFLASDLPRQVQQKLKSYSDSELIRFNAALAELDEQMERLMVIHQMLGTRISDTLTLQTDCLYRQDGHPMIQIRQMKTTTFVKPMQYNTVQNKVMDLIQKKDLRDDHGELFGFGTHMFRHVYGIRLTELHLDDWTIAKLLGHTSVKNVKFYRKMSLQIITDETREIRAEMSRMIRANLAGWEKEYEQILQDAGSKP